MIWISVKDSESCSLLICQLIISYPFIIKLVNISVIFWTPLRDLCYTSLIKFLALEVESGTLFFLTITWKLQTISLSCHVFPLWLPILTLYSISIRFRFNLW
jgi:hypothetical protein